MFGKPRAAPANDHLRVADIDRPLDEFEAMREVYELLRPFDDATRLRINEAVRRRLGDEEARDRYEADERTLDLAAADAI